MITFDTEAIHDGVQQILDPVFGRTLLFKIGMILLIIVGLNSFSSSIFGFNAIDKLFGDGYVSKIFYSLVGITAITIMFDRDTYLPFLGPMVAPCSVLNDITPSGALISVKIIVEPKTKILYWASEPSTEKLEKLNNWKDAYLGYENAGVTTTDENGIAILKVREPQPYQVPFKGKLEPHIHYRVCGKEGWLGRIKTVKIMDNKVEGFNTKVIREVYDKKNRLDISDYSASIF